MGGDNRAARGKERGCDDDARTCDGSANYVGPVGHGHAGAPLNERTPTLARAWVFLDTPA